jgi:hypothetical protein
LTCDDDRIILRSRERHPPQDKQDKRVYEPSMTGHYLRLLGLDFLLAFSIFILGWRFNEDAGILQSVFIGLGAVLFIVALLPIAMELGTRIEIYRDRIIYRRGGLKLEFTWDRLEVFNPDYINRMGFRYCHAVGKDRAGNRRSFLFNSLMFREYDQLTSLVAVARKGSWQSYMERLNISRKEMLSNPRLTEIDREIDVKES